MALPTAGQLSSSEDVSKWYTEQIESIPEPTRLLLEKYSGLAPDAVLPHVRDIRSRAFKVFPYPCIGQLRFLDLNLSRHGRYAAILDRLRGTPGTTFLDAGCCFGQDLRKLAFDGAPATALYGTDVEPAFFGLGHELFRDGDRAGGGITFAAGDLLDDDAAWPAAFRGGIDVVNASSLFHLFPYAQQLAVARRLVSFLRPVPGSMLVGRQVGSVRAAEQRGLAPGTTSFRHNVESFERFWAEVGAATGSAWTVEATLDNVDIVEGLNTNQSWSEPGMRRIIFTVLRQ